MTSRGERADAAVDLLTKLSESDDPHFEEVSSDPFSEDEEMREEEGEEEERSEEEGKEDERGGDDDEE